MRTIEGWVLTDTDADGTRRALLSGAGGERVILVATKDAAAVSVLRVCCSDAIFERLKIGAALSDAELAGVELIGTAEALPRAVLAALLV